MHNFMMGPAIDVTVNRNYIYQDAFDQLTEDKGKTKKVTGQFLVFENSRKTGSTALSLPLICPFTTAVITEN